jgi:hypothetical protein
MIAEVVKLGGGDIRDISAGLRAIADGIDAGEYGGCHNLVWVIDKGGGGLDVGLLGSAPEFGPTAHLLLAMAMLKIETGCLHD